MAQWFESTIGNKIYTNTCRKRELYYRERVQRKGDDMLLYLRYYMNQAMVDEQSFFRSAYMWRFGKDADVSNDVCQYTLHAIVPKYVEEYVIHIQGKEVIHISQPT